MLEMVEKRVAEMHDYVNNKVSQQIIFCLTYEVLNKLDTTLTYMYICK
jgi:hypothetical protein